MVHPALFLNDNRFQEFPKSLLPLKALQTLILDSNPIDSVPAEITTMTKLTTLSISLKVQSGKGSSAPLPNLSTGNIKRLYLGGTLPTGPGMPVPPLPLSLADTDIPQVLAAPLFLCLQRKNAYSRIGYPRPPKPQTSSRTDRPRAAPSRSRRCSAVPRTLSRTRSRPRRSRGATMSALTLSRSLTAMAGRPCRSTASRTFTKSLRTSSRRSRKSRTKYCFVLFLVCFFIYLSLGSRHYCCLKSNVPGGQLQAAPTPGQLEAPRCRRGMHGRGRGCFQHAYLLWQRGRLSRSPRAPGQARRAAGR